MVIGCVAAHEIGEGDLLSYMDGDVSAHIRDHVARCPACQAEVEALAELDSRLSFDLFRSSCPPVDDLLRLHGKLLGDSASRLVQAHLARCAFCRAEMEAVAAVPLAAGPTASLGDRLRTAAKRMIQAIRLDSPAPAMSLRGEQEQSTLFRAESYQVVLAKIPPLVAPDLWQIEGQLLPLDEEASVEVGSLVRLLQDDATAAQDTVDDLGYFVLEKIPAGTYVVMIETPTALIRIQEFSIP